MASAAVEMLTLSHCRKMMVFNTDFGLDSDTDTELVNTVIGGEGKRMLSEPDEDQDRGHVKKRRKQSKPVRIASSESLSDGDNYVENGLPEKQKPELDVDNDSAVFGKNSINDNINNMTSNSSDEEYKTRTDNTATDGYEKSCKRDETYNGNNSSLLPINLSNSKCSANDILAGYVGMQIGDASHDLDKTRRSNEATGLPFQEPTFEGTPFERESLFSTTSSSPLSFPSAKHAQGAHTPNNARHSGSPVRIFNPEAFCDLCNKEFCNKYFLKTHKANKHGIYSENIGPSLIDTLPSLPFINYFSSVGEVLPSSNQISRSLLRKPQIPVSLPQQNPIFLQKPLTANGNTRAFCNICQREFCNKYFVRRHKAKIHGIIDVNFPDTPPNETPEQKAYGSNDMKLCVGNHEKSEDHEIYSVLTDQQAITMGMSAAPTNEGDKQEHRPSENKTHSHTSHQQNPTRLNRETDSDGCTSPGMPGTFSPVHGILTTPANQADEVGKEIDGADRNKRIGIINSEAFCDICNKEYCNKYFLRTHKMRSHGISQPDWEKRDDRMTVMENSMSYCINQAMPLNLIVSDQSVDKVENDDDIENIFCNVCGQRFKDVSLLKMHVSYAHSQELYTADKHAANDNSNSISNEKLFKTKPTVKIESNSGSDATNRTVSNDDKGYGIDFQTTTRLLECEICHKNFDALALETHIETQHGNLLDEVGILAEENSDSQAFQREVKYDCPLCHKQLLSTSSLNQHIIECHGTSGEHMSSSALVNIKNIKEIEEPQSNGQLQGGTINVTDVQTAPTSSFCEICKKELCNKYFMKTHMQRMHGISIDNGAHIGGVVCDICNKELCSKYFLRVHKQNSHGIVDEILGLDISRNQSPGTDPSLRPSEQGDLNNRYFSHFTEVCTICSRRFRSMKWLKAHLLNDHGDEGKDKWKEFQTQYEMRQLDRYPHEIQKKSDSTSVSVAQANSNGNTLSVRTYNEGYSQNNDIPVCQSNGQEDNLKSSVFTTIFNGKNTSTKQYHCSYCPFSTSILAFLFVHERSHINGSNSFSEQNKKLECKICSLAFETEESYEKHCVSHTISDASCPTSNGFSTNQNERVNKPVVHEHTKSNHSADLESTIKREDPGDLQKPSSFNFKTKTKCSKGRQAGSEENATSRKYDAQGYNENRHEVGQGDLKFAEPYNGALFEDTRKELACDERPRQDAESDDEVNAALTQVKESLELIANKTDIPVSFSLPQTQKQVIMQPFVLEDSGQFLLTDLKRPAFKKSFLSSIVFLPVTERLTNPVTVSFKLTPTL